MITYDDFIAFAPPGGTKEERDAWFEAHDFDAAALIQVSREVAEHRLGLLEEGDQVSHDDLVNGFAAATLFGFELAVRAMTGERIEEVPE